MTNKEQHKAIQKISQDGYYLRRMYESCNTKAQVNSVNHLCAFLSSHNWRFIIRQFGLHDSIVVSHCKNDLLHDLSVIEQQTLERIEKTIEELKRRMMR